jgi:uncharacterized membrane protein
MNSSRQQLQLLQNELDELRSDNGYKAMAASKPKAQAPAFTGSKRIEQFIGLKLMHVAGIVVLVTGISIGVKYAIDKQMIAEGMRILLAYAAGIMLFVFSVQLKRKYRLFSAILFSGSMASVYFTTYAAAVYYHFIPTVVAFVFMCALTVYTAVMSVQYDRKEIAIIGMVGAYGIPFLVSANAERVVYFFTYILLINAGVLLLSFKKQWKLMTQTAMILTWILFIGWGITRNDHSQQPAGIAFMILYFLIFLASAVGFRPRSNSTLPTSDTSLLLLNNIALYVAALAVFGIEGYFSILSPVTGCLFLLTALLAFTSWKLFPQSIILQRTLTWQSIIYLLMFIAFEWDGLTVTFLWITISVLLFAWGVWLSRSWARLASALLMAVTLLKLLLFDSERFSTLQKIGSYIVIGILLLLFSFYYQKPGLPDKQESGK